MALEEYIYHGKKRLRCGYTTGSCAAIASKAAVKMLLTSENVNETEIMTPKGILVKTEILNPEITETYALCAVKKDSGDDPDITDGILIYAKAEKIENGIETDGGEGVGRVTKPGLDQPVGAAAINSVPRKMIETAVSEICEFYNYRGGIKITISIPQGKDLAKKTFNPKLGIEGGISIIGTTGIVEPMSNDALIETIRTEEHMKKAAGNEYLLLTLGNYGKSFISEKMPFLEEKSVQCSNFIGEAIDCALELDFKGVLIIGHIGKLVKLGAGIMNTHSSQADGRMDVLVTCGVLAGVDCEILKTVTDCVTVDAALEKLGGDNTDLIMKILMSRAENYLKLKVKDEMKIGTLMFSDKFGVLGKTSEADYLIEKITEGNNG